MFTKIAKRISLVLLAIILLFGTFAAHEWYAEKPYFFRAYLDREAIKFAFESPELLTSLGFLEAVGIKDHNAELNDISLAKENKIYEQLNHVRNIIVSYDDQQLSQTDKLSKEIALYLIDSIISAKPYQYHDYPVNQLFGLQNGFPSFMQAQHQIHDEQDVLNYLSRLEKVHTKFSQALVGLTLREQKGIIPPKFVIERVLEEMTAFVEKPVEENILYTSLQQKMKNSEQFSPEQQADFLALAQQKIIENVHPAYQLFIDYFVALKPKATNDDGFWHLPQGKQAYQHALKIYTTTNYTPEYIHQLGLDEVTRIQQEILTILAEQDFDVEQGFSNAIEALAADPRFYYPDTDQGRQQILQDYQKILDEINVNIGDVFNIRPAAGLEVVRIPKFKEKTSPGAYYQQPSIDGSRPGRFYANLYDIKATPKYSMKTLAYHEGIPGHHFQIAVAMELEGLPFFRKASPFTAYVEGWALYSEYLAWEMGFEQDPFDNVGRLQAELFRAVRLVVDTGIHHYKWTREQAIDYMKANTGMAQTDVVAEIERYIVMPGQATSYKVGMMKILELRAKAKKALGDKFQLRDFHDVVLKNGALPLEILERLVDRYINEKMRSK